MYFAVQDMESVESVESVEVFDYQRNYKTSDRKPYYRRVYSDSKYQIFKRKQLET